jgi:hypothetical protein
MLCEMLPRCGPRGMLQDFAKSRAKETGHQAGCRTIDEGEAEKG